MFLFKFNRLILLLACTVGLLGATAHISSEYSLKAVFIVKLLKFIEWPEGSEPADKRIKIGLLGKSPIFDELEALARQNYLIVKNVSKNNLNELSSMHVLYVSSSVPQEEVLNLLKNTKSLTIGETEYFPQLGGMVNLLISNNTLKYELNIQALKDAGISVNTRVLRAADKVW